LISSSYIKDIITLRPSDSVEAVISLFDQYHVSYLPVLEKSVLIGIISIIDIASCEPDDTIADYIQKQGYPIIHEEVDALEVLRLIAAHKAECAAIVNLKNEFIGLVYLRDLAAMYATGITHQHGATISISMHPRNYSLFEIARLVESNDAKILHFFITHPNEADQEISLTMRLNVTFIGKILNAFERFNYQVTAVYNAEQSDDDIESKYKYLIHYLGK
jgi:acetoin utilization protein AcuB